MNVIRRLIQIAHPKYDVLKNRIQLAFVREIHTQLHGLFQCLQQLLAHFHLLAHTIAASGEVYLFSKNLVSLFCFQRDFTLDLLFVPCV